MTPYSNKKIMYSEEVKSVIGHVPKSILQWGMSIIFLFILLFFIALWLVRYPEIIRTSMILNTANYPKAIISPTDTRIKTILVKEGDFVRQGDILAFMESSAVHESIFELQNLLNQISQLAVANRWKEIKINYAKFRNLGELQEEFQSFYSTYLEFQSFITNEMFEKKKQLFSNQISNLQKLLSSLEVQKGLSQKALNLEFENYQAQKYLLENNVSSKSEMRDQEGRIVAKEIPIELINASIYSNNNSISQIKQQLLDLENKYFFDKQQLFQSLNKLLASIERWKKQYLLVASQNGNVLFPESLQEAQAVTANQTLFYVQPVNTFYEGEMYVSQFNFGELELGQKVIIRLQSYPYEKYGSLIGKIKFISKIPRGDKGYLIKVSLNNGLKTDMGNVLTFRNGLIANAQTITKKNRLIYKFFKPVQEFLDN